MGSNLAYEYEPREELIGGKVVAMSPRPTWNHNRIAGRIFHIFETYLEDKPCSAVGDGTDLFLTEEDNFVPDFMVVCDPGKIQYDGVHGAPDLVVEVRSPSTSKRDKTQKKDVYARCGVREYWIVDPFSRTIDQYLLESGDLTLHESYMLYPKGELSVLTEEERAAVPTSFKCSLFDDLDIVIADVFKGMLPY